MSAAHGVIVAKDEATGQLAYTRVDTICRDVFQLNTGHWKQIGSYTLAERVFVNGKHVPS